MHYENVHEAKLLLNGMGLAADHRFISKRRLAVYIVGEEARGTFTSLDGVRAYCAWLRRQEALDNDDTDRD